MSHGKAETVARRAITAREGAAQLGVSSRTIRRLKAEARGDFEARALQRRQLAAQLRNAGWSYKEIADELECSVGAVGALLHIARREGLLTKQSVKRAG
ncbi:sigma factor-like helix-turn-helix DNA-binding protein [Nocardia tengchongensis]|uniref:sigma factor-like helix-turn-helix DNA-binding protein n=1 Tax=Nocardia tengchongensis TaxID=2055889 RepID=UPI003623FE72